MSNQPQLTLTIQRGPNAGQTFQLISGSQTIGRSAGNDIAINDSTISRQHARITVQPNGIFIQDLGSSNGTFVNGQRISSPTQLRPGDMLQVGTSVTIGVQSGGGLVPASQPGYVAPAPSAAAGGGLGVVVALAVGFVALLAIGLAAFLVLRSAQPASDQIAPADRTATFEAAVNPAQPTETAPEEATSESAPEAAVDFSASKTTVQVGECATLRWNAENAQEVRLDGERVPNEGNRKVCPQEDSKTYRLTILTQDGEVVEKTISMTVPPTLPPPPGVEIDFSADQTTVNYGECTTLRWSVKNAQGVRLNGEKVSAQGTQQVCPEEAANTYQLLVDPLEGELVERSLAINVPATPTTTPSPEPTATSTPRPQPQNPSIDKFIADQYTLNQGSCTTLRWTVRNAQTVRLDGTQVASQGSQRVCPSASSNTYNLVATGAGGGSVQSSVQISVLAPTSTPVIIVVTQPPPPPPAGPPKYDIGASVGYVDGDKRCFTLQGYMENVKAAYLDGGEFNDEPLTGPSWAKKVCHKNQTTYTMFVQLPDGSWDSVSVTREGP